MFDGPVADSRPQTCKNANSRPKSPFFRPSTAKPVKLTQTISTPKGTHTLSVQTKRLILQNEQTDKTENKSNLLGTYSNLVNTIVGAGIIGIPYAMRETGLVAGICLIFCVALLTDKSLRLLISTGKHANVQSYETLMESAYGRFGFVFISLNMFIMSFGAMLAYLIVLKDTFPVLLGISEDNVFQKRLVLLVSSLLVILPLSLQRDMADLAKTSTISVVCDIIMVIIISICSPARETIEAKGIETLLKESVIRPSTFFVGLGVLSFAFVCQDSSFIIAGSMKRPTKERWATVTRSSLLTCALLATIVGIVGYLGFGDNTEGNILNNFKNNPDDDKMIFNGMVSAQDTVDLARGLLGLTMFSCFPLSLYVARHACVVLLFEGREAHDGDDHIVLSRNDRRIILTVGLYVSALVPAMLFEKLGPVLAVTGCVAGSCLSYIGPGMAFLGVHSEKFLSIVKKTWNLNPLLCKWMYKYPSDAFLQTSLSVDVGQIEDEPDECCIALFDLFQYISWYLLAMPVWVGVANMSNFRKFEEEQATKSPAVQLRLGRISIRDGKNQNKGTTAPTNFALDAKKLNKSSSFDDRVLLHRGNQSKGSGIVEENLPLLKKRLMLIPPSSKNGQYGTLEPSQAMDTQTTGTISSDDGSIEDDPQETEQQTLNDFLLAILFILLGIIALCAGILSISAS